MKKLDEFDRKAKQMLEEGKKERIEDILREWAMTVSYEQGKELENPDRAIVEAGLEEAEIDNFTEYRVAKSLVTDHLKG